MKIVILAICALMAILGVVGIVSPASLEHTINLITLPNGLYVAAGFRVLLGTALYLIAPRSRAPRTLRVLGVIIILGGISLPFLGVEFITGVVEWWLAMGTVFLRAWGFTAIFFAALLAYAVTPGSPTLHDDRSFE